MTKLSTILRHAIDTELWDGVTNCSAYNKSTYLCIAVERAADELIDVYTDGDKIKQIQDVILTDLRTYNTTTITVALSRSMGDDTAARTAMWDNNEEQQQIRYMYADFLAYMLEDEGN